MQRSKSSGCSLYHDAHPLSPAVPYWFTAPEALIHDGFEIPGVSETDIRAALDDLDARTLRRIVIDLQNQDEDGAAELLAQNTQLSQRDAAALIQSAYDSLKQQFGDPENSQNLAQDVKAQLIASIDGYIASFDTDGGPRVTEKDIQQALNQIDAEAAEQIGAQLITGDTQGAKRTIARKTDLTTAQINELVDGATNDINDEIAKYQTAVKEAAETVSAYTAAAGLMQCSGRSRVTSTRSTAIRKFSAKWDGLLPCIVHVNLINPARMPPQLSY